MNFDKLNSDNFLIYATKMYDCHQCANINEFNSDLRRLGSAKRLMLRKARGDDNINMRMLLNHIIIISNLFGNRPAAKMLFFYCPKATHPQLKAILNFLNICPTELEEVDLGAIIQDEDTLKILEVF